MKITKKLITHKFAFDLRQHYRHHNSPPPPSPLRSRFRCQPCNPIMSTIMDSNGQSIKLHVLRTWPQQLMMIHSPIGLSRRAKERRKLKDKRRQRLNGVCTEGKNQ